jgi:predicted esterase
LRRRAIVQGRFALTALCAVLLVACGAADADLSASDTATTGSGVANGAGGSGGQAGASGAGGGDGGSGGVIDWQPVDTPWCSDGWTGLDSDTCFYVPQTPVEGALLIYLHGMMPPDASAASQQALVAAASDELGFVALFPKGKPGLCSWDPSVEDWLCWPTSRANVDAHAGAIIDSWHEQVSLLAAITGQVLDTRYLLGFSNGGYFASFIALEELWPHDGAALAGAGRSYIDAGSFGVARPPIFIAVGEQESAKVIASAQNLADVLQQEAWPHELVIDPQRGHELRADDFTRAYGLWFE